MDIWVFHPALGLEGCDRINPDDEADRGFKLVGTAPDELAASFDAWWGAVSQKSFAGYVVEEIAKDKTLVFRPAVLVSQKVEEQARYDKLQVEKADAGKVP